MPDTAPATAHALGVATVTELASSPKVLDTYYPSPRVGVDDELAAALHAELGAGAGPGGIMISAAQATAVGAPDELVALAATPAASGATRRLVWCVVPDLQAPIADVHDAYLRLHLLSSRLVRPHGCSLEGLFGVLPNVVWTDLGPFDPEGFEAQRTALMAKGVRLSVRGVDKFPPMVDYVVPTGVRIADASRVRLGAYLGDGTTVMHEGFVNFNAGTEGPAMVEGRISSGVFVGAHTDIGGGASIMGTLSGGGKEVVSLGSHCLLGANGGLGISLGDNCVVEAGLYVTAGTIVTLPDGSTCKAAELSGRDDMLFRRNSRTGAVEMLPQSAEWGGLNADLHSND